MSFVSVLLACSIVSLILDSSKFNSDCTFTVCSDASVIGKGAFNSESKYGCWSVSLLVYWRLIITSDVKSTCTGCSESAAALVVAVVGPLSPGCGLLPAVVEEVVDCCCCSFSLLAVWSKSWICREPSH